MRYRDWEELMWLGGAVVCFFVDYHVVRNLGAGFQSSGWSGLAHSIVDLGPKAISLANGFIAEMIASVIVIGFMPGGRVGFVIGTTISLAVNGLEVWLGIDWIKDRLARQKRPRKRSTV